MPDGKLGTLAHQDEIVKLMLQESGINVKGYNKEICSVWRMLKRSRDQYVKKL